MRNNQFRPPIRKPVTILQTLLTRGYFPKELPPSFFTEQFARYASTKKGRHLLDTYEAADKYTECGKYHLALPGVHRRELRIPHPASFVHLAALAAKNFRRLLKKAAGSPFSKADPDTRPLATGLFNRPSSRQIWQGSAPHCALVVRSC